jgi:hypothetical protein
MAVLVVVLVAGLLTQTRPMATQPVAPSTTLTSVPIGSAGVTVLMGNRIVLPDGTEVTLKAPADFTVLYAAHVYDGWLFYARGIANGHQAAWNFYQSDSGRVTRFGDPFAFVTVSVDGRMVVAQSSGVDGLTAYELPSLRRIGGTRVDSRGAVGGGPVGGGWAVLYNPSADNWVDRTTHLWNPSTGERRSHAAVDIWGVARDGMALRRVPDGTAAACVDVVPVADALDAPHTGVCAAELRSNDMVGHLSPDGTWAVLTNQASADGSWSWVSVADIRNGVWRPAPLGVSLRLPGLFHFHGNRALVLYDTRSDAYLCSPPRPCTRLAPPDAAHGYYVVPDYR